MPHTTGEVPAENTSVVASLDGAVLRLDMNMPARMNSLDVHMVRALRLRIEEASISPEVRTVVLTGSGRAFSTGATLQEGSPDHIAAAGVQLLDEVNMLIRTIRAAQVLIIAAVNGPAAGVAVSIALACDLSVAKESSYFLMPFTNIGLMPDGGATVLLSRAIGPARAATMIYGGRRISATTAYSWGLVGELTTDELFDKRIRELANDLARGAQTALALTKSAHNAAADDDLNRALDRERIGQTELLSGPEFREGRSAFKARRPANFMMKSDSNR